MGFANVRAGTRVLMLVLLLVQAVRGGLQFNTASFDIEARDAYGNQVTAKNVNFVVSLTDRDSNKIQTKVRPCTLECPFVWETRVLSGY